MPDMHYPRPEEDEYSHPLPPEIERSDAELIAACLAGDPEAWDALIARYQGFIFGLGLRLGLSHADADDLFQDVCLKLFGHLHQLRDVHRLSGWLGAVVRQEVWGRWRARRLVGLSELTDEVLAAQRDGASLASMPDPAESVLALEREHFVRLSLQALTDDCRRLLELLYGTEPASYAEAARALAIPVGSVGPRRARCLERLKKALARFGY